MEGKLTVTYKKRRLSERVATITFYEIELKAILKALSLSPRDLMRKCETEYKENNFTDESLSSNQLISAMLKYPKLIERPIVVTSDNKFALGRPPESVLKIL